MQDFALGVQSEIKFQRLIDFETFALEGFRLNKAASKTFGILLATEKPLSLLDGTPVKTGSVLAIVNRHEYHHIFPKAYLKSEGHDQEMIDTQSNICMLSMGNNREISDIKPSIYFKSLADRLGNNLERVLRSNMIDNTAYEAALSDNYNEFISARKELIIMVAKNLCGE